MDKDTEARNLFDKFLDGIKRLFIDRRIVDVDSWDGSPSRWPDTQSYCKSCLINLNEGPTEDWVQAKCKLPVRNPGQSDDTYVRQAVYAAAARFNQVDAPAEAKDAAKRKLVAAYMEMDEEPPDVLTRAISWYRLHEVVQNQLEYPCCLIDIYSDNGLLYALTTMDGYLYRYPITVIDENIILGDRMQVTEVHRPVAISERTIIRRLENGRYRWVSVSGTAVLNRSGEIDSRDLFDSFVEHAELSGEYPIRQFYHQGEHFRTGKADFLARVGYCYVTSGVYDDTPLAMAEVAARQRNPEFWGDSIGFFYTDSPELVEIAEGVRIPVYRRGVNIEISTLPEKEAAHLFTRTEVRAMSLTGKALEAFKALFDDEEKAQQWLENNPEARNRAIDEAGLITRDNDNENKTDDIDITDGNTSIEVGDDVIEVVTRAVVGSEVVTNLTTRINELNEAIIQRDAELSELKSLIDKLAKTVDFVSGRISATDAVERRQLEDDLPAKFKNNQTRVVYRPREAHQSDTGDINHMEQWAKEKKEKGIPRY